MKVLLVHSYYQLKGGEDAVFEQEFELMKSYCDAKAIIYRNKSGLSGALQFLSSVSNLNVARSLKQQILEFNPDIVQIYNWHYATGPIVIRTAKKMGIKTIVNVQNYRLLCPSGSLLFKGKLFENSIHKRGFPWSAVFNKVYRRSFLQTFWLSFVVWYHKIRGTWASVDRFIVPTNAMKQLFTNSNSYLNIPASRISWKPNFSVQGDNISLVRNNTFLFVGRLSEEKGISVLLDAFKNSPYMLKIGGAGPLESLVKSTSADYQNIKYLGKLNKNEIKNLMSSCTAFVFTSVWYEPFGLVITEALSNGCPLIASDIGSPVELVTEGITGYHFKTGDPESLRACLERWQKLDEEEKTLFRKNCVDSYKEFFTPEKNKEHLLTIYNDVISHESETTV